MKTCLLKILFLISGLLAVVPAFSQGSIMLAGGAGEVAGGWSDAPYRWVVEHATNKRIAVISYDTGASEWIPNYFKGFGAEAAKNFIITNRISANLQSLYDTLITYHGVFIKGGDQGKYYEYYKGTKTHAAIQYIYDHGGVVSGTSAGTAILSPVVYTAQIASVDPAIALLDAYSGQITLANDFLKTISSKYIYDTHFLERGRFGRLPSFMASWYKKTKANPTGIGVDDHTALCVEKDGKAKVFGTGAVSFFHNMNATAPYDTTVSMLRAGNMKFSQFTHGCSIDLNTGESTGLTKQIQPPIQEENGRYNLFLSGTDYPSEDSYNFISDQTIQKNDPVIIVTGSNLTRANDVKSKLAEKGFSRVSILQALTVNQDESTAHTDIDQAKMVIVVANDYLTFMNFVNGGGNGSLLKNKFKQVGISSFFIGDNARFAGKTVVDKYTGAGFTSYHGTLEFRPGLGLLQTTAIMPNTFINADTYENTVSGIPYCMIRDSLRFGIYLIGNTFAMYGVSSENQSYIKNLSGSYPLIVLENEGTLAEFANQGPYSTSRNVAGFKSMNLKYLGISDSMILGRNVTTAAGLHPDLKLKIYPNPAKGKLFIEGMESMCKLQIADMSGRIVTSQLFSEKEEIDTNSFSPGLYLVHVKDLKNNIRVSTKLCIEK